MILSAEVPEKLVQRLSALGFDRDVEWERLNPLLHGVQVRLRSKRLCWTFCCGVTNTTKRHFYAVAKNVMEGWSSGFHRHLSRWARRLGIVDELNYVIRTHRS